MMSVKSEDKVLTRQQRADYAATAFQFVVRELFDKELDDPLVKSLLIVTGDKEDIRPILDLEKEDIDDLHYFKASDNDESSETSLPTPVSINKGDKGRVKRLIRFEEFRRNNGDPVLPDWSNVTGTEFDAYRIGTTNINVSTPIPPQFLPPNPRSGT